MSDVTTETFEKPGEPPRRKALLWFEDEDRALVLNKTNASAMAMAFGKDFSAWRGREIVLRCEPVNFAGKMVPSLRLSPIKRRPSPGTAESRAESDSRQREMNDDIPF